MQIIKNKILATLIALLLLSSIAFALNAAPSQVANAHTPPWTIPSWFYVSVAPQPVGVGQQMTIVFWDRQGPPGGAGTGGDRWRDITINITDPDGNVEKLGPFYGEATGSGYTTWTPTQAGVYKLDLYYPGQVLSLYGPTGVAGTQNNYINDTYLPCSTSTTFVVQQTAIPNPVEPPLPVAYWTRPIEGENTDWYTVASNWLGSPQIWAKVQLDGTAPNSAHIMWTRPYMNGGVVGGDSSSNSGVSEGYVPGNTYYTGMTYEGQDTNPIVIQGKLYYTQGLSDATSGGGYYCVDLQTGKTIYWLNETRPSNYAQLYDYETMNQHGIIPNGYMIRSVSVRDGSTTETEWMFFDALSGMWLFNETNVPSGTVTYGPNGELLIYQWNYNVNTKTGWVALWNDTAPHALTNAANNPTDYSSSNFNQYRPVGKVVNASGPDAYTWNYTITGDLTGDGNPSVNRIFYNDVIFGTSTTFGGFLADGSVGNTGKFTCWAVSVKPGSIGQVLWHQTYQAPNANMTYRIGQVDPVNRVWVLIEQESMSRMWGYSLDTGNIAWPNPTAGLLNPFDFYFRGGNTEAMDAYGNMYISTYGGIVYCYNMKDGGLTWTYGNGPVGSDNSTNAELKTAYGHYPNGLLAISDGKVYIYTTEHSPNAPPYKGASITCIDAYNGTKLWSLLGWATGEEGAPFTQPTIADGYMTYLNTYDQQIYCLGKGPSALTVDAPMTAVVAGNNVVIRGTVIDKAAGTQQTAQAGDFPNGVPCVSDVSQSAWMEYVYMQKPMPTNATGVNVSIDAIDPNGNLIHLGTATSDASGTFSYMWNTPDIPGKYTIVATFAGTNSYWPSSAETSMAVAEAVQTTTTPPIQQNIATASDLMLDMVGEVIAIIIAIAIVGILMLRKK